LLGDGGRWGIQISYKVQPEPKGIAQAFLVGEEFIDNQPVCLILGDNIFYGKMNLDRILAEFEGGARIFGYPVHDPERYGVVEFDAAGTVISIEEKPKHPKSHYAVPGLYLYDADVVKTARAIAPSPRGELEITDVNLHYLRRGALTVERLGRGIAWLDTGTHKSLLEASNYIEIIESRQGMKIACLEEIALRRGFIDCSRMRQVIDETPSSPYRDYLQQVYDEAQLCGTR
jgi:glucose-1-phosphate thymidylyltransferase